jgi:recombination protein RecT
MAQRRGPTNGHSTLSDRVAGAAVSPVQAGQTMSDLLKAQGDQITRALPRAIPPDRYLRVILTELRKNLGLNEVEPYSFLGAVMTGAQLGLEFGPLGHAYLVPFWSGRNKRMECQLIIGYKGYITLARRSGDIEGIVARSVHENDVFEFEYGLDDHLVHRPRLNDRGAPIAYYGVAKFRGGGHLIEVMSLDDVGKRKARSQSKNREGDIVGPWVSDPDAMSRKTVIRAMVPWLPLSVEAQSAAAADEAVIRFDPNVGQLESPEFEPPAADDDREGTDQEPPVGDEDPGRPFDDGEAS